MESFIMYKYITKKTSRLACTSLKMPKRSVLPMPGCHDQDTAPSRKRHVTGTRQAHGFTCPPPSLYSRETRKARGDKAEKEALSEFTLLHFVKFCVGLDLHIYLLPPAFFYFSRAVERKGHRVGALRRLHVALDSCLVRLFQ